MKFNRWLHSERSITITTVVGCPNMCPYCPQDIVKSVYLSRGGSPSLDLNDYYGYLQKIPTGVKVIFGGFGEPWCHPKCTEMVLAAHSAGHKIDVYTSLVGMKIEDVYILKAIPFESSFTVHLPDDNGQTKIRLDQNYLEVLRAIGAAGIRHLHFDLRQDGPAPVSLPPAVAQAIGSLPVGISRCHTWGGLVGDVTPKILKSWLPLRGCPRFYRNVLLPNGDVALCCWDMGMQHIIGNLKDSDYESLFQSNEFKRIKSGFCRRDPDILCSRCDSPMRQILGLSIPPAYRPVVRFLYERVRKLKVF